MALAAKKTRYEALRRIAGRILGAPDLPALTRHLTQELPAALGASGATLLMWDRRLESFEVARLVDGRYLRTFPVQRETSGGEPRWLLSEGQLLETRGTAGEGVLVPLLARSGLTGTLLIGPVRRRKRPVSEAEARLVSIIATRAALALENHAYQKELIASERLAALGAMAGMLAHDFRGPMTVIRGYAETLLEPDLPGEEVTARARLILEAADRLSRMTTQTLDYVRGAERLVRRSVPLGILLGEMAASLEQELPGLRVGRDFQLDPTRRVALDVDKLRRTVWNIAANAFEATGEGVSFTIAARLERREGTGEHLVMDLGDDGPGIPREVRERIFEPFVTLGKARGTGLGLAVARRFVEDHGGSLELLPPPEPPAHGARFRISIPLGAADAAAPAR